MEKINARENKWATFLRNEENKLNLFRPRLKEKSIFALRRKYRS